MAAPAGQAGRRLAQQRATQERCDRWKAADEISPNTGAFTPRNAVVQQSTRRHDLFVRRPPLPFADRIKGTIDESAISASVMGYGRQIFILDFRQFANRKLVGERRTITPNEDRERREPGRLQRDDKDELIFVSFDAEAATSQYSACGSGLAHVLNDPAPKVDGPVPIGIESADGERLFDYSHETLVDRVIVVVGFPTGWSANFFDPWPSDAKHVNGRLTVKFNFIRPNGLQLRWTLVELGVSRTLESEVARIKRRQIGADSEKVLLLFIHGLGGSSAETWGTFPELLQQDGEFARGCRVRFFSYPTMLWRSIFSRKAPSIQELAAGLRTQIENRYPEFQNVVLVCHSLGGLIARKYLLDEFKAKRPTRVRGLLLFAVPNNGTQLASTAKIISWRHNQVRQLCRGSDFLDTLNEDWFTMGLHGAVRTKYVMGTQDRVVDRQSARATWGNPDVETVVGKGHRDIVKPQGPNDDAVIILKNFVRTLANGDSPKGTERPATAVQELVPGPEATERAVSRELPELHIESIRSPHPALEMMRIRNDGRGTISDIRPGPLTWDNQMRPVQLFNRVGIIPEGEYRDVHYWLVDSDDQVRSLYDFMRANTSINALTTISFDYTSRGLQLARTFELTTEIRQGLILWEPGAVERRSDDDASKPQLFIGNGQYLGPVWAKCSIDGTFVSNVAKRQETFAISVAVSVAYSHSKRNFTVEPGTWLIHLGGGAVKPEWTPNLSSMDKRMFSIPLLFRTDDSEAYFASNGFPPRPESAYQLDWGTWHISLVLRSGRDRWQQELTVALSPTAPPLWANI